MARCLQEDCAYWDGHGCPCAVLDIEPVDVRDTDAALRTGLAGWGVEE